MLNPVGNWAPYLQVFDTHLIHLSQLARLTAKSMPARWKAQD